VTDIATTSFYFAQPWGLAALLALADQLFRRKKL
jgi:hypothetical protein